MVVCVCLVARNNLGRKCASLGVKMAGSTGGRAGKDELE
jgi:hypothetical protein